VILETAKLKYTGTIHGHIFIKFRCEQKLQLYRPDFCRIKILDGALLGQLK